VKYVRYKARMIRAFIGLGLVVSLLVMLTGCWPFNTFPVAYFTASPLSGPAPLSVAFSAMLSEDPDGFILKWEWDFGDGSSGSGESISHTYTTAGTYTVVLRVTDDDRATATAQRTITVTAAEEPGGAGAGPTASFTATPLVGVAPLSVTFNASASAYAGHAITYYSWDFGDGVTGTGMTTTHTYAPLVTSTYNVVLRIIAADNTEGTTTKSITATVTTPAPPATAPTASFTTAPNKQVAPLPIDFDPSNSTASGNLNLDTYIWTPGDGTQNVVRTTDAIYTHRYVTDQASEEFAAVLRVIDEENNSDTETRIVTVENYQPEAGFEIYYKVNTLEATVKADLTAAHWLRVDVEFTAADGVQTPPNTVWVRSVQVTDANWTRTTASPTPATGKTGHPAAPVWNSNNYSHDREGQYWTAGVPPGFPAGNPSWGIKALEVDWGDGGWDPYAYEPAGNVNNVHGHAYDGTGWYTLELTARDYLNGLDTFSRKVRITN